MNADADLHPTIAKAVRLLRQPGRWARKLRGDTGTFFEACVALDLEGWQASAFPGIASGQDASDIIAAALASPAPAMISRLGTIELATLAAARTPFNAASVFKLLIGDPWIRDIGIHEGLVNALCENAGFFPADFSMVRSFVTRMLNDMPGIDVLGSWCRQEALFTDELANARRVRFRDLEPYMHARPWSNVLQGRRVLVIHPFASTIERQVRERRHLLFDNPAILPEFDMVTLRAVQSIANNPTGFASWFDALHHMEDRMAALEWDIAIIGCGAYGLPLCAHAKRLGRKGVHLGGQTQLLFGIKGKRWETGHERIKAMFNQHWVYPAEEDRPSGFHRVEGGAYW